MPIIAAVTLAETIAAIVAVAGAVAAVATLARDHERNKLYLDQARFEAEKARWEAEKARDECGKIWKDGEEGRICEQDPSEEGR